MPNRPLYLVVNRFDDECGDYHAFAAGLEIDLAFVTLACGLPFLDHQRSREIIVVNDLSLATVLAAANRIMDLHGRFAGAVGISEKDVVMMAELREHLQLPGPSRRLVHLFKNKVAMKDRLHNAGYRVPRFLGLSNLAGLPPAKVAATVQQHLSFPMILKPVDEGASRGVIEISDSSVLEEILIRIDLANYEAEEFIYGPILHVDGILRDGSCTFVSASQYVGTCLDFARSQAPLGSVVLDPGDHRSAVERYALACLETLGLRHGPFHLELIENAPGEFVFLEVGMRPGGGETSHLHREHVGIDLYGESFRCLLGLPLMADPSTWGDAQGLGYLLVPEPRPLPNVVQSRISLLGKIQYLYAEVLPEVGHIFTGSGGYDHVGGRFRFRSPDRIHTIEAIQAAQEAYELKVEPC